VLPASTDASRRAGGSMVRYWWSRAEKLACLVPQRVGGWHLLRRKFASDLMDQPFNVLCGLGGWKTAKTVPQCYQRTVSDSYLFVPASLTDFVEPIPAV